MADRMRVTSLIGDTGRAKVSAGRPLPNPWSGSWNRCPAGASHWWTLQRLSAIERAIQQQLTFWHGYYDQNQYLPLVITCAENDQFVMLSLRPGNVPAALGADDDLAYLVTRLRQVWPDVALHFRGDCGFGVPGMYDVCERLRVWYTFGLSANAVLQREAEGLLVEAVAAYERARQAARQHDPPHAAVPSRLFTGFWYQARTWPQPRWVVAKAEANDRGTNRRFVVTNRPGSVALPGPTYDEYAARGESENRNKEFKCDLALDRLSDHRFVANYFRLYLHAAAMNLLVRLRRFLAEPLPVPVPPADTAAPAASQAGEGTSAAAGERVPAEALTGAERQHYFRLRRQHDPLGEAPPAPGGPCSSRWRRKSSSARGGSSSASHRVGRTWTGIVGCASACVILSRCLFPIPPADPLDSPLRCLPPGGGKGAVCLRAPARPKSHEMRTRCP
jgi:hypothetical protein